LTRETSFSLEPQSSTDIMFGLFDETSEAIFEVLEEDDAISSFVDVEAKAYIERKLNQTMGKNPYLVCEKPFISNSKTFHYNQYPRCGLLSLKNVCEVFKINCKIESFIES